MNWQMSTGEFCILLPISNSLLIIDLLDKCLGMGAQRAVA